MAKFKFSRNEYHQVVTRFTDEFDTTDKEKWAELLKAAKDCGVDESELEQFPKKTPRAVEVWFDLYKLIDMRSIDSDQYDDWVSDRKGGYDVEAVLTNEDGRTVQVEKL